MSKKPINYVDNKKFYEEIVKYRKAIQEAKEQGKEEPRMPDYIGKCILQIAERLSIKPCFANYSFREEMISDGIENCFLYFRDYDPDYNASGNPDYKPNPFAYFTQVIYYAFLRRISKEEKNRYIIYKNFQETITNVHGTNLLTDSDDNLLLSATIYDNISDFMEKFEAKEEEKKNKRKKIKEGLDKFIED